MRCLWSSRGGVILLALIGSTLLVPACRRPEAENTGAVEGTVLDTSGKPLADVRMFNVGDGPKPVETRTDTSGHFRLEGLDAGPVYVFAEKAEYRFAGARATTGAADVALTLVGQSEPMPSRPIAADAKPLDAQPEVARRMLEKLWACCTPDNRSSLIVAMSSVNPQQALRWAAESNANLAELIHGEMAGIIADQNLDEALSLLEPGSSDRLNTLVSLARRYMTSDPAKATRCAEELLLGARACDQPWRTSYLAETADILIRLGNKEVGRKLLEEAGAMAAKLGDSPKQFAASYMAVEAIAPHDSKRALSLMTPLPDDEKDSLRAKVAAAICHDNLDQALDLIEQMGATSEFWANHAWLRIAWKLAPTRPADAFRVVEMIGSDPGFSESTKGAKPTALGWIAVAVAPRDKPLAFSLVDRAFAILMTLDESELAKDFVGDKPGRAALLAVQAGQIGYPDMESVVYRVLACRPTPSAGDVPDGCATSMAAMLALVDPRTARDMLELVDARDETIRSGSLGAIWVQAWCLVDAKRGQTLFDEAAAAITGKPDTEAEFYGLIEAAKLVAANPREKARRLLASPGLFPFDEEE
jgi:hypothetical protein